MKLTIVIDRNMEDLETGVATWQTYIIEKADDTIETDDWARVLAEAELLNISIPEPEIVLV